MNKLYYRKCPLQKLEHGFFNVTKCTLKCASGLKERERQKRPKSCITQKIFDIEKLKNQMKNAVFYHRFYGTLLFMCHGYYQPNNTRC